jgi:hypothetical protein
MPKTKKKNRKPMNTYYPICPICGSELIWGGDHDIEEESDEYTIVSNLSCINKECEAFVEVYHQKRERKSKKKVQYKTGMISCGGIEHINPDTEEIDFT